ncbi:MAG TPA: PilZ domain-containing protein [bacterium]|nr:PilZ domain-containing protein [bacterium]
MASDPTALETESITPDDSPAADLTEHGRYIPYGGGSAGWFENSGVLKSERHNNYRFHAEMDLPEVRSRQFERWGPAFDRREGATRTRRQVAINLLREGSATPMITWDINNRGIRLQFHEPPALDQGDSVSVELLEAPDGRVLALLDAQVVWVEAVGTTRQVWNLGLFFPYVSAEAAVTLKQMLAD